MALPDFLLSAHALVKALKAAKDPPQDGGPTKLTMAALAMHNENTYLPNKEQIVLDYILDAWHRSSTGPHHPLLNPRYHELFHLVAGSTPVDVAPLYVQFLTSALTASVTNDLTQLAAKSFRISGQKQTPKVESWVEVWTALLAYIIAGKDGWSEIWVEISKGWLPDASTDTLKKLSLGILPTLPAWAKARSTQTIDDQVVFEKLFSWPALQSSDPFSHVVHALGPLSASTAYLISALFPAYVQAITVHRHQTFIQPLSNKVASEVYLADRVRKAVCAATGQALDYLSDERAETWDARAAVWLEVNKWGGYLESEQAWSDMVGAEKTKAETVLMSVEACRASSLVVLEQLEHLDHHAANLDAGVVGWCLAAPHQLFEQAEKVLVALSRYHRLTRSFPQYCTLLRESCRDMLESCDHPKAVRAVYDLVIGGILARPALRGALSSRGLSAKDVIEATVPARDSPVKRQRTNKPSSIAAAKRGIDSRLARAILDGWTGDWAALATNWYSVSTEGVRGWSEDVLLAARLRDWNTFNWAEAATPTDFDIERLTDEETLPETRLELSLYAVATGRGSDALVEVLAGSSDFSDSLWRMLRDLRLFDALSCCLLTTHFCLLLKGNPNLLLAITADLVESPPFIEAVDQHLAQFDATDRLSMTLLPFASKSTADVAMKEILLNNEELPSEVDWIARAIASGRCSSLSSSMLGSVARKAERQNHMDLLREIYRSALRSPADTVVLLDDLQASRGRLLASFFDAVVESNPKQSALSGEIRDRLRDLSGQILKTVSASDLSMWLASLCLNRWLGEAPADRTSARLLHSDMRSWAQNDVITAAKIFRLENDCDGVLSCLCVAFASGTPLELLLQDTNEAEVSFLLPLALSGLQSSETTSFSLAVITGILGSGRESVVGAVKTSALATTLLFYAPRWSSNSAAAVLESLCAFVTRNPYALKPSDVVLLLDLAMVTVSRRDERLCTLSVRLVSGLLRHRRDALAQHVPIVVDFCRTLVPQFGSRHRVRALGVVDATLFSRFLVMLVETKNMDTFHAALMKHLPAILVAYVRVVADPRGHVRPDVRREMLPGLWALCDTLTAGGRVQSRGREGEALGEAFGLGDGPGSEAERDVWADMWSGWAAKRYTGQG